MQLTREEQKRRLLAKAELLWRLVTTTPGVGDLAEPMKRVERHFERLTKDQRTTIAVIAQQFDKGCHEIDAEEKPKPIQAEVVQPDEVIPPPQGDQETDGSGTGD